MSNNLQAVSQSRTWKRIKLVMALSFASTGLGAPLTTRASIQITQQPTSQEVVAGADASFSVTATSDAPLAYQWFKVTTPYWSTVRGATNSTLTLTNVQIPDASDYLVYISGQEGIVFSAFATLTIDSAPQFTSSSGNQTVIAGTNTTLWVATIGKPAASLQWQFNGVAISGATNVNLTITNAQSTNQGAYSVLASNFLGVVTNVPMELTVIDSAPFLNPDLKDRVAIGHSTIVLGGTLYGSTPMTCQWSKNGISLPGATNGTLVLTNIQPSDAGKYSVTATNSLGYATSRIATLVVKDNPLPSTIVAWGDSGQTNLPAGETNVVELAASALGTVYVRQDGTMGAFGFEIVSPSTFAVIPKVATVSSAGAYALALGQDGKPVSFGVTYLTGASDVPSTVSNALAVAVGNPRLVLLSDGTVVGWTPASAFEIPDPGHILGSLPGLSNVRAIAMRNNHCVILKSNGTVQAFGANGNGQSTVPAGLNNVAAVAAGSYHSLALKNDGTVVSWGDNSHGATNVPAGLSGVLAISAGDYHNLALKSDGTIVAWGDNTSGQCNIPAGLSNVVSISAGSVHSVALTKAPGEVIAAQGQTVNAGGTASFSFLASGYQPMSYQWQLNGVDIPDATNATLVLTNVPLTSAGAYRCVASNGFGVAAGTAAELTVLRQTPQFVSVPQFTTGSFRMQLKLLSGHGNVVIEATTNLVDWQAIFTNPPVLGSLEYIDPDSASLPGRFYRAVEQ